MLHLALIAPEIPWNTGNAGRTALAVGARLHLVEPLGFALDERALRRAGLDYWEHVAPVVHPDLEAFERALPALGAAWFFSAEAPRQLYDVEVPADVVFVFGPESRGLAPALRERHAERLVALPVLDPRVRSLNLSTAVGVAAYEYLRRNAAG